MTHKKSMDVAVTAATLRAAHELVPRLMPEPGAPVPEWTPVGRSTCKSPISTGATTRCQVAGTTGTRGSSDP
jgi:hypothetical protein